jgi:lipopolysaccharide heptosyltransferase II
MARTPRQRLRLTLLRAFARFTHPSIPGVTRVGADNGQMPVISRILVVRPDHMGDLLFTTPALRALRRRFPDAHITVLVGPWGAPVLSNNPHVDDVLVLPFPGFTKQPKSSPWQPYTLLRHWAQQLSGYYDLVFIQRFDHWWGALLAYLAGIPLRVGYAIPEVVPFLSHALPYPANRHEVEQNLELVNWGTSKRGITSDPTETVSPVTCPTEFFIPEDTLAWAQDLFGNKQVITIHPGAGAAIKLWPVDRWAAVADALGSGTDYQLVLTGSNAELPLCREVAAQMKAGVRIVAGETTLDQLAAIMAESRLVLGLDSGPLHLAVAVGTPTVHLYGPVSAAIFGPWGPSARHHVLISDWPCIPCNRLDYGPDELGDHPCVREIDVERVLGIARQVLAA